MRIIVGVDPGKTVGIACIDLNGKLISSAHCSGCGMDWIVESIREIGIPVIVASDRERPSELVRKVNSSFNSRLFSPAKELSIGVKSLMGRNASVRNPHERDAYVAAMCAYKHYENKFKQAERLARERKAQDADAVKALVVSRHSIDEAISNRRSGRK